MRIYLRFLRLIGRFAGVDAGYFTNRAATGAVMIFCNTVALVVLVVAGTMTLKANNFAEMVETTMKVFFKVHYTRLCYIYMTTMKVFFKVHYTRLY